MEDRFVLVESDDDQGITHISLNRPEKRNALSIILMEQLCQAVEKTVADTSQRVIIFNGKGPVFCAGLDLEEARDPSLIDNSSQLISQMLRLIYTSPLVTIAVIHGAAIAGGAGLMSACDCVIAAEGTKIGYPEVRWGLVAAQVMPFLRRQLREREARELLLFGSLIDAGQAQSLGMINRIAPEEECLQVAKQFAEMAIRAAPKATAQTKELFNDLYPADFAKDVDKVFNYHQHMRRSEEAQEGMAAFMEKRKPHWR